MGREARLARRTGPIDNRGDLDRIEIAITQILSRLKVDPRMAASYTAWFHRRDLGRLMSVPVSESFPDHKAAAWRALVDAVLRTPTDDELAGVRQILDGIGPTRRWPRQWAARAFLQQVWPAAYFHIIGAVTPEMHDLWVTVRDDGRILLTYGPDDHRDELESGGRWVLRRRGHRPQAKGHEKVQAAIDCWFDAYLQDPPVPIPVLTQQYATGANRVTEAHSAVYDRLELAEMLLNRVLED
jgi:hypothetical protein